MGALRGLTAVITKSATTMLTGLSVIKNVLWNVRTRVCGAVKCRMFVIARLGARMVARPMAAVHVLTSAKMVATPMALVRARGRARTAATPTALASPPK